MKRMDQSKKKQSPTQAPNNPYSFPAEENKNTENKNKEIFEPDDHRREEETEFYKSNQNFYRSNPDGFREENHEENNQENKFDSKFIKDQIDESNRVNRYITSNMSQNNQNYNIDNEVKVNKDAMEEFNKPSHEKQDVYEDFEDDIGEEIYVESLNSNDEKF
jgi:hypothetical protein